MREHSDSSFGKGIALCLRKKYDDNSGIFWLLKCLYAPIPSARHRDDYFLDRGIGISNNIFGPFGPSFGPSGPLKILGPPFKK